VVQELVEGPDAVSLVVDGQAGHAVLVGEVPDGALLDPFPAAGIGAVRVPGATSYQPHTVLSIPMDQFRRVIDVNLYGVLFSNRAVARWMAEHRRGGSIINLASIMSKMPSTSAPYSVSKAGVWMLTKCLAQELASQGIRVNAIGPGFIETPMTAAIRADAARSSWAMSVTPMGRYGKPEEIAHIPIYTVEKGKDNLVRSNLRHSSLRVEKKGKTFRFLYTTSPNQSFAFNEAAQKDLTINPKYVALFAIQGLSDTEIPAHVHIDSFAFTPIVCEK